MKQIAVRVDEDLLARIEAARGDVPRERWLRAACEQALEAAPTDETPRPSPAGREAKTEVATRPARSAATARQGASRPSPSPRTSAAKANGAAKVGRAVHDSVPHIHGGHVVTVALDEDLGLQCGTCERHGPPKHLRCKSCGHQAVAAPKRKPATKGKR